MKKINTQRVSPDKNKKEFLYCNSSPSVLSEIQKIKDISNYDKLTGIRKYSLEYYIQNLIRTKQGAPLESSRRS